MSTTQDRLRQAARFTRLDADRELLTEAADALDRREAVIRLLEGEVALAVPGVPDDVVKDAARYRWLRDSDHWPAPFASSQEPEPVRGTDLDSAIDAAMLASRSQEGKA